MHHIDIVLTLAVTLGAALGLGFITHKLKISPIVGYLLAGIVVGPHTPGFIANQELANQLAEVGVVLLMFGVGLNFHFRDMMAVHKIALPGAIGQSILAAALGAWAAISWGWSVPAGIVFGLAISVSSTVVLVRVLSDKNEMKTPIGHISVGWLVIEDLFTIIVLLLLPAIFGAGISITSANIAFMVWEAFVKIAELVGFTLLMGIYVIPWLLKYIEATKSKELFTLSVLTIALGIAVGSTLFFGTSIALGAFLAGIIVGRSEFASRAAEEALPMRDAFAVLFFVSVGMLFSPKDFMIHWIPISITVAIIVLGKPLIAFVLARLLRQGNLVALSVGAALAQIGEFSFILATVGRDLKILPESATDIIIGSALVSIILNPIVYSMIPRANQWIEDKITPLEQSLGGKK